MKTIKKRKQKLKGLTLIGILGTLLMISTIFMLVTTGCTTSQSYGPLYGYIFLTDTYNGRVYTYNPEDHSVSQTPLLSTGANGTGAIYFYSGYGYIATGYSTGGVYTFDPDAEAPQVSKFSSRSFSAQYITFISADEGFVTDYGEYDKPQSTGGVYRFNPADINSDFVFIDGTEGNAQDIITVGRKVFVASNGTNSIKIIDTQNNYSVTTVNIPEGSNPTGLCTTPDEDKVYVTNTGTWGASDGTISVIDTSDLSIQTLVTGLINPTMITYSNGFLYITGYSNSYYIDTTSQNPSPVELKDKNNNSFGGGGILVYDGLVYITNFDFSTKISKLYIFDEQTKQEVAFSPVNVGVDGEDGITGIAVYR